MRVNTFPIPRSIVNPDETVRGRFAVVIDVLRATSVIATAMAAGASSIIPLAEVEEARSLYAGFPEGTALLCGERGGLKVAGFHLGNSPLEFTPAAVRGRTLVMTTTNGTRAILSAAPAARLALGAMANASAVAKAAAASGMDVTVVCAGTRGFFSLEDTLAAGAILDAMQLPAAEMDDLSLLSLDLYRRSAGDLIGALKDCAHAKRLVKIGFEADIEFCMRKDFLNIVPFYQNGRIGLD